MNHPHTPAADDDTGTLHNLPDGLLDAESSERPPTSDTPFVPPYAEHVDAATPFDPAAAAFAFADAHVTPAAPPAGPGQAAPEAAGSRPGGSSTMAERARRWGAPAALVAAGLLGGMAVTGAVTNASASTPASTSIVSDSGTRAEGPTTDSGQGLTLDQLEGTPYGDGRSGHGDGHRSGGRSMSDGFTLAPNTQGTTGASG